jgi:hypothetical protein
MNTPPACSPRWGRPKRLGGFLFLDVWMISQPTLVERRYRKGVPRKVPKGRVLVHNEVIAKRSTPQGEAGFQWWTLRTAKRSLTHSSCAE